MYKISGTSWLRFYFLTYWFRSKLFSRFSIENRLCYNKKRILFSLDHFYLDISNPSIMSIQLKIERSDNLDAIIMRRSCNGSNSFGILCLKIRDNVVNGRRVEKGANVRGDNNIVEIVDGIDGALFEEWEQAVMASRSCSRQGMQASFKVLDERDPKMIIFLKRTRKLFILNRYKIISLFHYLFFGTYFEIKKKKKEK